MRHDGEMPQAMYPTYCAECGTPTRNMYCNQCYDALLHKESITREAKLANYWQEEARKREEKFFR